MNFLDFNLTFVENWICHILDDSQSDNSKSENLRDTYSIEHDTNSCTIPYVMPHEGMLSESHEHTIFLTILVWHIGL